MEGHDARPGHKQQEEEFNVYWSPEKVSKDEILAAATSMFTGLWSRGLPAPVKWMALDAVLTNP